MENGSRTRLYQDQRYVEVDERVREEPAVLYDLEHATPVDRDALAKQRDVLTSAIQSRRELLRRLTSDDSGQQD
jgi:hypothetical protein